MNIKYFIFSLLVVNTISINSLQLKNLVKFTDKNLQKEFDNKKQIYKDFFIEYMNIFKKDPKTFEEKIPQIIFIREFLKKNNIENKSLYKFDNNYDFKYIEYYPNKKDMENNCYYGIIEEKSRNSDEISNSDENYNFWMEDNSISYNLLDLKYKSQQNKNKNEEDEIDNILITILYKVSYPDFTETNSINLKIHPEECKQKIPNLKNDLEILDLFNKLKNDEVKDEENTKNEYYIKDKESTDEYKLNLFEFLFYMYEKYGDYIENEQELNKEIEIIKEVINFYEINKITVWKSDSRWGDIYFNLRFIKNKCFDYNIKGYPPCLRHRTGYLFQEIKKIDKEYYLYRIIDENSYMVRKIKDFKKLKKLQIMYMITNSTNYKRYSEILNSLLNEEKIYYF